MPQLLRQAKLKWKKSANSFSGSPAGYILSGYLYNLFPAIMSEDLLVDGGYIVRLAYLVNEYTTPVEWTRLWFAYDTEFDNRQLDATIRETLLVGRQVNRETPPTNAPPNENTLPQDILFWEVPLSTTDSNMKNYTKGLEIGKLLANEAVPIWFALKIPPLVQPVIVTMVRVVAEGVLLP